MAHTIKHSFLIFCGLAALGLYHARMVCAQNYSIQTLLNTKNTHTSQTTTTRAPCHSTSAKSSNSMPAAPIHAKLCCDIGELANSPEQTQLKKIFNTEKISYQAVHIILAHLDPFSTVSRKPLTHYLNIPPPLNHPRTTVLRI